MKKKSKSSKVLVYLKSLKPLLAPRNKIGCVAARNYHFLSNSIVESDAVRLSLIGKYGEKGRDERGVPTYTLKMDSPNFQQLCDELAPFSEIKHEVELMITKYDDAVGNLLGEKVLTTDWVLGDQEGVG